MVAVEALDRRAAQVRQDADFRIIPVGEKVCGKSVCASLKEGEAFIQNHTPTAEFIVYYENHFEDMAWYCEFLGSSDPENAAQNGFMNAYDAISTFRGTNPNSMKSWLYKITRNVVIDELRSRHRENTKLGERISIESFEVFNVRDHQEQLMDVVVNSDIGDELLEMLRVLPGKQGYALLLYSRGYKYKEVGELLGTTEASVKQLILRGRREMRELLSSELALN